MSWRRHACNLEAHRTLKLPTNHIWISDDIVNGAWHIFALLSNHKRHGSHTPGPLEARRRAARRRLTNVALVGEARIVDPSFPAGLAGGEQSGFQWQAPNLATSHPPLLDHKLGKHGLPRDTTSADVVSERPPLPSWLEDFMANEVSSPSLHPHEIPPDLQAPEATAPDSPLAELDRTYSTDNLLYSKKTTIASDPHFSSRERVVVTQPGSSVRSLMSIQRNLAITRHDTFCNRLKYCHSAGSIQQLAIELNIDLRALPYLSKLAFQQLFGKSWRLDIVIEFLENSSLNARGAGNLHFLCKWLCQNNVNQITMQGLPGWIQRSMSLGTLFEEDILQVALAVSRVEARNAAKYRHTGQHILTSIVEGLLQSSLYKIPDLKAETLDTLLQCISTIPFNIQLQHLGTNLVLSSDETQLCVMHQGISLFFQKWILCQPNSKHEEPASLHLYRIGALLELLRCLPKEVARSSMVNTCVELLRQPAWSIVDQKTLVKNLRIWWSALVNSELFKLLEDSAGWQDVKQSLECSNIEILASYLQALDDHQKCLFLLGPLFRKLRPKVDFECWSHKFKALDGTHTSTSPFVSMLRVIHHYDISIPDETMSRLISLLRALEDSEAIIQVVEFQEKICKRTNASINVSTVKADLNTNLRRAFHVFESCSMVSLEMIPELAESMIANPQLHPNTALHFRARRKKLAIIPVPASPNSPDLLSRLNLLERMCLAYARAAHLPPRLAFRKVRHCYLIVRRERLGPISPAVTHALVQAGITRPLQDVTWVSTVKLQWILGLVRRVEGDEVADQIDMVVYQWRGMVLAKIRERQRMESARWGGGDGGVGLKLVRQKYDRMWLEAGRKVFKPVDGDWI